MILGHSHASVIRAVREALRDGTSFGAPTAREVELAELITAAFPALEQVRLVSSGTEASMSAMRLARACTGLSTIVTFAGCVPAPRDPLAGAGGPGGLAPVGRRAATPL